MPSFGARSMHCLESCHSNLHLVAHKAIELVDFAVIEGHRTEARQNELLRIGKSQVAWPSSSHNFAPSRAFDFCPWPVDWSDREQFTYVAGVIVGVGHVMGIELGWGGDWDRDGSLSNNVFDDLGHIELLR